MELDVSEIERKRGMAVALQVVAALLYDGPAGVVGEGYSETRLFAESPFDSVDERLLEGLRLMDAWCMENEGALAEGLAALEREHLRLFVGVGAPLAPSWATFYSDPNHQLFGRETLEVRAAYRELGLRVERERTEPDDHLGLMTRFLAHALLLECEALERGDGAEAERLAQLQGDFLAAHVLPWIVPWAYSVEKEAASGFYRGCGAFAFGLLREYAALFGIAYRAEPPSFARARR